MSSDIYVTYGGDTSALEAANAVAVAQIRQLSRELAAASREMVKLGASADSDAGQKVLGLARQLTAAKDGFSGLKAGASTAAEGIELSTRQMAHGIHGVLELVTGEGERAGRTFAGLAVHLLAENAGFSALTVAGLAAAAALGYLTYQAVESDKQLERLGAAAAEGGFAQIKTESAALRDEFAQLSGESESTSTKILASFAKLGNGGEQLATALIPYAEAIARAEGTDLAAAMKTLEGRFSDLDGAGTKYLASQKSVLESEREHYTSLVASGQRGDAMVIILRAMETQLGLVARATTEHKAALDANRTSLAGFAGESDNVQLEMQALKDGEDRAGKAAADMGANFDAARSQVAALGNASDVTAAKLMADADKIAGSLDRVGSQSRKLGNDAATLLSGLNRAFDSGDTARIDEYEAAIKKLHEDTLVNAQKGADPLGLDRDAMAQDEAALHHLENTWRGSQEGMKQAAVAFWQGASQQAGLSAAQQESIAEKLEAAQKAAFDGTAKASVKAAKDTAATNEATYSKDIEEAEKTAQGKIKLYELEAKAKGITEAEKLRLTLAALSAEKTAVDKFYADELAIAGLTTKTLADLQGDLKIFNLENANAMTDAQEQAAAKTTQAWDIAAKTFSNAFTSQIDPLLKGTENWGTAGKKVLADLTEDTIKYFAEQGLLQATNAAKQLVLGNTVVVAHVSGDATMSAADASSSAAGLGGVLASVASAIKAFAGEVGAGVAAFLAPVLGPAAIPAGTAAAASVMQIGSADIGMWDVPKDQLTLIHQNELVMPASQANAFRGMLNNGGGGGGGAGTINQELHVHAVDSQSVADMFRWNRSAMMSEAFAAMRAGAHHGLKIS